MVENLLNIRDPKRPNTLSWLENTVSSEDALILGYNFLGVSPKEIKEKHKGKRLIIYQLEQISAPGNLWYNPNANKSIVEKRTKHLLEWYDVADEIWEYDVQNYQLLKKIQPRKQVRLMPITSFKPYLYQDKHTYTSDIFFYGSVNKKRMQLLKLLAKKYKLLVACQTDTDVQRELQFAGATVISPKYFTELWEYMYGASIVLNTHYYSIQEQVRISEAVANGKIVLSEKSANNAYDDLIVEFTNKGDITQKINSILSGNDPICNKDLKLAYEKRYSSNIQ